MTEVSPVERPCANPACRETTAPGSASFPFCSPECRGRANEVARTEIIVLGVKAGHKVSQPCKGGGFVRRACEVDSLVVQQGETVLVVPASAIEKALSRIGRRPAGKATNGHG